MPLYETIDDIKNTIEKKIDATMTNWAKISGCR